MSTEDNKEIARKILDDLASPGGRARFELLHENAVWTVMADRDSFPPARTMSKPEFIAHIEAFLGVASDMKLDITGITAEGRRVAVEAASTCRLPNGRILNQHYHFLFEMEYGRVIKAREYLDTAHGMAVFAT